MMKSFLLSRVVQRHDFWLGGAASFQLHDCSHGLGLELSKGMSYHLCLLCWSLNIFLLGQIFKLGC